MSRRYAVAQTIDPAIGGRVLNCCWFLAGLGVSTFQMQLLAQSWFSSQQAMVPACMVSAWIMGSLFAARLPNNTRLWGSCLLLSALLWLEGTGLASWHMKLLPFAPVPLITAIPLALFALFLGTISTAWLSQRRPWPPVGARTSLARGLVSTMVGLFVVWVLPSWSGLIGMVCMSPLLALDFLTDASAPLPVMGGLVDSWVGRYWSGSVGYQHLHFDGGGGVPSKWCWSYLAECSPSTKGYLSLTLLASGVTVLLGGLWGAVPTPFAGGLFQVQATDLLGWLLAGQLGVLVIAACGFGAARHMVGNPDRLLPQGWRTRARCLAVMVLFVAGGSLIALGLPSLQAPWWLALSLASYTFALSLWGILLPRLQTGFGTEVFAQRHLLALRGKTWGGSVQLAFERAQEERVGRTLDATEGLLMAIITPAIGGLIDLLGSVDTVLVIVGACFVLVLAGSLLATGFRYVIQQHTQRQRSPVFSITFHPGVMGNPWNAASRKVSPAF